MHTLSDWVTSWSVVCAAYKHSRPWIRRLRLEFYKDDAGRRRGLVLPFVRACRAGWGPSVRRSGDIAWLFKWAASNTDAPPSVYLLSTVNTVTIQNI